jgi:short-subunit dehydrogenase
MPSCTREAAQSSRSDGGTVLARSAVMAPRSLTRQVALITGASSGVGWQTAIRLGNEGMRLCVTARRAGALEELRAHLAGQGVECLVAPGDAAVPEDIERVVADCVRHYGRIDMLVNNAGAQIYAPFEQYRWEEIERVFAVTCFSYLRFAREVLPHFRARGSGHIINVLSMLSIGAAPLLSTYAAAKHALLGWAESLRLELTGSGIDVSTILAPSVATPMFDHAQMKLGRAPKPIPPVYDPDVVAKAVVQCAYKPASRVMPVFLQGPLIFWVQQLAPWIGDFLLSRWGVRLQMRDQVVDPEKGNLFEPVEEGVGPYGSVPPTPAWMRYGAGMGLLAGGIGAAALLVRGLKALRAPVRAITTKT